MSRYLLGHEHESGKPFWLPRSSFDTHWHLIGGTGKGKTTAIHAILHELFLDLSHEPCVFVIDRMGNLSFELLLWMASEYCTEDVRQRLVYVEPSREDVVLGFNPLLYDTEGHAYYKVSRAAEIILRGWASQNLEEMPRLARWLFNSFYACALLGLTIADTIHLLLPGSPLQRQLLGCLPPRLQYEWQELVGAKSAEVTRILESTRNRLKPFYESPVLRNMFGATTNRLDVSRFMREGKIVLLNLAPNNRLPEQIADAIGGLVINEVLTTARSMPPQQRFPTYLFLDEFQRFVGPDMESAIPEVRQLGIKLLFSHQSFSQLERGDLDLTSLIFQAQSRMIFGVQGEDADLLAHELASLSFDPRKIKDELYSRRQRIARHEIVELAGWSHADQQAQQWMESYGQNWGRKDSQVRTLGSYRLPVVGEGTSYGHSENRGDGGSAGSSDTTSRTQHFLPVHEDFTELVNRTYTTFEEDRRVWGRDIRRLPRGHAFVRLVDNPEIHQVAVKRSAPGHLSWSMRELAEDFPEVLEDVQRLIEQNFQSEFFVSPQAIEIETQQRLQNIVSPVASIPAIGASPPAAALTVPEKNQRRTATSATQEENPFL